MDDESAKMMTGKGIHQDTKKKDEPTVIAASEFQFDPVLKTCVCPAGESLWLKHEGLDKYEKNKNYFSRIRSANVVNAH